jgi:hypothetical protein
MSIVTSRYKSLQLPMVNDFLYTVCHLNAICFLSYSDCENL